MAVWKCSLEDMEVSVCMNKSFWKNKNVLVTGYEGFLGSNLTKRLVNYGANVIGIDVKIKRKKTILTEYEYKGMVIIKGSVTNCNLVKNVLKKYKIEYVFHLAAEAIVDECYKKPLRAFSSNICGTWMMLEACRNFPAIKSIVIASSDKAYGSHKELPYREDAPLQGNHPYDVSKSCADLIANTYYNTYRVPVAVTRCGNIYGPGDFNYSRLVPDAIRCALQNKQFIIRSDGKFTRDYVYVEDIINGYVTLAEKMKKLKLYGEAFNFSNENPVTVIELVKKIYQIIGRKLNYRILNDARCEIKHQYLSSKKARGTLNWKPTYGLDKGLNLTINWYRNLLGKPR